MSTLLLAIIVIGFMPAFMHFGAIVLPVAGVLSVLLAARGLYKDRIFITASLLVLLSVLITLAIGVLL